MSKNFTNFANSFQATARLKLEGITCLMKHLENPQDSLKFIHVAGTNGKGSVCSFLQNIFTDAGYRTGKYTSPNLISVCERISFDGELISENDINRILKNVEIAANKVKKELCDFPTQFEIWTAAAFCYFKEKNCDIVVLETGLGGTHDATNIINPPLAAVITTIDIDHTEYLGDSIEKIAAEKAGIIKKPVSDTAKGLVISSPQCLEAGNVLKAACIERKNTLIFSSYPTFVKTEDFCEIFDYVASGGNEFKNIKCGIPGFYQPQNAVLAIETALCLGIDEKHIKSGIQKAKNPARFEIISQNPVVIYDGAHNKNGMTALVQSLKRYFPKWQGATFIMAFMGDKDIYGELELLKNQGLLEQSEIFAVKVKNNPRSAETDFVVKSAKKIGTSATPFNSLKDAYTQALGLHKPIILCGSLYLYKDFSEVLKEI